MDVAIDWITQVIPVCVTIVDLTGVFGQGSGQYLMSGLTPTISSIMVVVAAISRNGLVCFKFISIRSFHNNYQAKIQILTYLKTQLSAILQPRVAYDSASS